MKNLERIMHAQRPGERRGGAAFNKQKDCRHVPAFLLLIVLLVWCSPVGLSLFFPFHYSWMIRCLCLWNLLLVAQCIAMRAVLLFFLTNTVYWTHYGCLRLGPAPSSTFWQRPCPPHVICSWIRQLSSGRPFCPRDTRYPEPPWIMECLRTPPNMVKRRRRWSIATAVCMHEMSQCSYCSPTTTRSAASFLLVGHDDLLFTVAL